MASNLLVLYQGGVKGPFLEENPIQPTREIGQGRNGAYRSGEGCFHPMMLGT